MRHRNLWSLALGFALCVGCAAEGVSSDKEAPGSTKLDIVNGSPEPSDPGVMYLIYDNDSLCTGVLIAPKVVLTARHCVTDEEPVAVGVGADIWSGYRYADVIDVHTQAGPHADIAALVLDSAGLVEPYEWARSRPPVVGDPVVGIGYGRTDTGSAAVGDKLRGEAAIAEVYGNEFVTDGPLSCHGDSGGPAFVDGIVAGVVSRGTTARCSTGESVYTRTDSFVSLIEEAIRDSEGGSARPDDGSAEPSDSAGGSEEPDGGSDSADDGFGGDDSGGSGSFGDAPADDGGGDDGFVCEDTCPWSFDGICDDGGAYSVFDVCAVGTDCSDCGPRPAADTEVESGCSNTCSWASDGVCDDGGLGSSYDVCPLGTDCNDCGAR